MNPSRYRCFLICGSLWIVALLICELLVGPGDFSWAEVFSVVVDRILQAPATAISHTIIWDLRLPRALLAGLIGAALACAGVITQGMFRNPLAAPDILGISSGAAVAAVVGFLIQLDAYGLWLIPLLAAGGALAVLGLLTALMGRGTQRLRLLLIGVIVGAWCSAWIALFLATNTERWDVGIKVITWLMGSLEGRTWDHLRWFLPAFVIGLGIALWLRNDLDVLQLGHETALSLGVQLRRFHLLSLTAIALFVGAATAVSGVIGFVGLIIPHLARSLVGPHHRQLLPFAALMGAILMLIVDMTTRMITTITLPPGVVTSLLGAPFFLWILFHAHGVRDHEL